MEKQKKLSTKLSNFWSYTDKNLTLLPIFSASKGLDLQKQADKQSISLNNGKKMLHISYGKRKPSIYDRLIFAAIEKLYLEIYNDHHYLLDQTQVEINKKTEQYLKEENKTQDQLSDLERQEIIYWSMRIIRDRFDLRVNTSDIDKIVNQTRAPSKVKASIQVLSQTYILMESTYEIGNEFAQLSISQLPLIEYSYKTLNNAHVYRISLNPLHLYNILTKNYIGIDLQLLLSFKSPIATRLAEYLKPRLYGLSMHRKTKTRLVYHNICQYLQVKIYPSWSLIKRQMQEPLNELVEKKIISHWDVEKTFKGIEFILDISGLSTKKNSSPKF